MNTDSNGGMQGAAPVTKPGRLRVSAKDHVSTVFWIEIDGTRLHVVDQLPVINVEFEDGKWDDLHCAAGLNVFRGVARIEFYVRQKGGVFISVGASPKMLRATMLYNNVAIGIAGREHPFCSVG